MKRLLLALTLLVALLLSNLLPPPSRPGRHAELCMACITTDVGGLIKQG